MARGKAGALYVTLACLAAVLTPGQARQEDNRQEKVQKVAETADWSEQYLWLTDRTLLVELNTSKAQEYIRRTGATLVEVDLRRGTRKPITRKFRWVNGIELAPGADHTILLPDGHWLLWPGTQRVPVNKRLRLYRSSAYPDWYPPHPGPSYPESIQPYWQPAPIGPYRSRGWAVLIEFDDGWHSLFYDPAGTLEHRNIELTWSGRKVPTPEAFHGGSVSPTWPLQALGLTPEGWALATPFSNVDRTKAGKTVVHMWEYAGSARPITRRIWSLPIPEGCEPRQKVLSPQGDRLAWVFYHPVTLYSERTTAGDTEAIYVSKTDGSTMQMLARTPIEPGLSAYQSRTLRGLRWLPDGRRLSFLYRDALYTIPVP